MKKLIAVVQIIDDNNVDARFYNEDMSPLIGKNSLNEDYHVGQICSSMGWAKRDLGYERYKKELDYLFPDENGEFDITHMYGVHNEIMGMDKTTQEENGMKIPSKREEVVMNEIWKVFDKANDFSVMLNFNEMREIEEILLKYKQQ